MSNGIAYISKETSETNAYNEMLMIEADDYALYFRALGMVMGRRETKEKLSPEGAAELYWSMFIEPSSPQGRTCCRRLNYPSAALQTRRVQALFCHEPNTSTRAS